MAKLTFDDEFNSLSLWNGTSGNWQPSFFWSPNGYTGSDMSSWWVNPSYGPTSAADANPYSIVNFHQGDGALNLAIMPTPKDVSAAAVSGDTYLSGLLTTENGFQQEYGYFEINAEMSSAAGSKSGFWLQSSLTWPPEIDICEVLANNPTTLWTTAHTSTQAAQDQAWTSVDNMTTSFNTYAVDWEANYITWYFNGTQVYQIATPADMHQPLYVALDDETGTSTSWEGAPTSATETGAMKINYVHVWASNPYTSSPEPTPKPYSDSLTLRMSEDAWQGDAQFVVRVDGQQVGGVETASALHATGDSDVFQLNGVWGTGLHTVQIQFLNDAYGGTAAADRNLYVNSLGYDGVTYAHTKASMYGNGTDSFTVGGAAAAGPVDTLVLSLSEDAWQGDAQFTLSIDGKQVTTPQTVTATHGIDPWQSMTFAGSLGIGPHTIGVSFINDSYGGSPSKDRNLYVSGVDADGRHYGNSSVTGQGAISSASGVAALMGNGTASFTVYTSH